jgi:putative phosphoribosyl transferase
MIFQDRSDAGRQLAAALSDLADSPNAIVLAIPRGGVAVAAEIARALHLPLDVFLARKLGVPGHEELAFGAVTANGTRYLDEQIVRQARLTKARIDQITGDTLQVLEERAKLYRAGREPLHIAGRSTILVDDGIATGASFYAAVNALRQLHPAQIIAATPVAPPSTASRLRTQVDRLVCLDTPLRFQAVGQFYASFPQLSDGEVIQLLQPRADSAV